MCIELPYFDFYLVMMIFRGYPASTPFEPSLRNPMVSFLEKNIPGSCGPAALRLPGVRPLSRDYFLPIVI
jgi:hypothetical protein